MAGVFTRLTNQDVIVAPYEANKTYNIRSEFFGVDNIQVKGGLNNTSSYNLYITYSSTLFNFYPSIWWQNSIIDNTIKYTTQYYQNLSTSSYSGYVDTGNALTIKNFPTGSGASILTISIPRDIAGLGLYPGTFTGSSDIYPSIYDDSNYNLIGVNSQGTSSYIGNIFYEYNYLVFTTSSNLQLSNIQFKNRYVLYENIVKCSFKEWEYLFSNNPTFVGSGGSPIYSSSVKPYITTIGLYNDSYDLLAVAKLPTPIQSSDITDTTFLIRWDS